jgi:flagellar biosynthesis/type III secretory pathway chaperone
MTLIINSSTVSMAAARSYEKKEKTTVTVTKTQEKSVATTISDSGKALSKQKQALLKKLEEEDKKKQEQSKEASTAAATALKDPTSLMSDKDKQTYEVLKRLLDMLNQARESIRKGKLPTSGLWDITYSGLNDKFLSSKDSQSANIPNLSL